MRALATLAAPLGLAQALWLRARLPRLPEAEGPRAGRIGAGRLGLLILGDSSAAGVGAATQDQALAGQLARALADLEPDWLLHARTGATTPQALASLDRLPPRRFAAAVLALGVNDVTRPGRVRDFAATQRQLAQTLRARFGVERIYLSGVPPMGHFPALPRPLRDLAGARAAAFDAGLAGLARDLPGLRHLPFDPARLGQGLMAADGFHPGPALYALWAADLAATIRADFGPCASAGDLPPGGVEPGAAP